MRTTGRIRTREGWLLAAAAAGLIAVALAVQSRPAHSSGSFSVTNRKPVSHERKNPSGGADSGERTSGHGLHIPWHLLGEILTLIIAAAIVVGVALYVRQVLRNRLHIRRTPTRPPVAFEASEEIEDVSDDVRRTFDQAWTRLRTGDAREAIVACWVALEDIAADAGFARWQADTATDLGTRLLSRLTLDADALQTLAELYREARFSTHPMSDASVAAARGALATLRSELAGAGR